MTARRDYSDAIGRLLPAVHDLSYTQPEQIETVRKLVDEIRQCLQTIVCCSDPLVLAAADTERPEPIEQAREDRP